MMNKLLQRQVQKHFGNPDTVPAEFSALLKVIGESYDHYEKDRNMLERSIELTSTEMIELNDKLRKETAEVKKAHYNVKTLFENINEVLFSVDMVSYKLIQMSAACERVYGYTPQEFMAPDLWQKVIHPDDLHISYDQIETLTKGQQVFNQYRIIHKDGSIRWVENKVIPTLDETGRLVRLDGLTNDITQKRNNAQKLQESEVRFRSLIENSADILTLMDADNKLIYESPAVTKTLGYVQGENIGRSGFDLIHEDDHVKTNEALQDIMTEEGTMVSLAVRVKTKKGDYIFTEGNITNLLHVQGINAIVCNFRDVTTRVEAELHLAESKNRYKMVYQNPFLGIAIGSVDGIMQNVNEAFCNMVGYTEEELYGKHFSTFTLPEDTEKEIPYLLKMANGEIETYQMEKRYVTKSKALIWVELSISCVKNSAGEIQFLVAVVQDITPKKTAEDLLRKSEVNLTAIVENTDAHVYSLDRNFCYLRFNNRLRDTMKKLYGIEVKAGDKVFDFLEQHNPAEAEFWKRTYTEALAGKTIQFDKEYSAGPVLSYVNFSINPIWENKNIIGLSCFVRDITQQKLAEDSLQKSEANLRNILENTDTAYVLLDENSTILSYNLLACELAAEEMEEYIEVGKNYVDMMLEERREEVRKTIKYVLEKREHVRYEIKYAKGGEKDKWLTVSMHPIFDHNKKVLGLSVAATDITDRKNAEQLIKLSNERYELVTKATNDVIWDWDIVNNKIYRSENYKQIFGYDGIEDNIYTPSTDTNVHPEDIERILQSIDEKVKDSTVSLWEDEYRYFRKNGELAYVQDRGYIIYDENKKPVRMVGAMRDITPGKVFAIERDKITSDLIRQNKNLEQFAYIVSHNLRAPLANITGLSRIIQTPKLEAKVRQISMDGLVTSVKKLDDVIIDLTNILQVKREIDEKREHISFSLLLEDIKSSVHNFIQEERVTIYSDFTAVNDIFSVKSYMHSIFYNLILNSIKYKKPGRRPHIEICSWETENKITLSFKDNGSGIDLSLYGDKIFGLYKRFHYDVEGKGMGLFMVKTQVESLEGNITVNSRIDEGAEFIIEFPKKSVTYKSTFPEEGQDLPLFTKAQIK